MFIKNLLSCLMLGAATLTSLISWLARQTWWTAAYPCPPERQQKVDFVHPYFKGGMAVLARYHKKNEAPKAD